MPYLSKVVDPGVILRGTIHDTFSSEAFRSWQISYFIKITIRISLDLSMYPCLRVLSSYLLRTCGKPGILEVYSNIYSHYSGWKAVCLVSKESSSSQTHYILQIQDYCDLFIARTYSCSRQGELPRESGKIQGLAFPVCFLDVWQAKLRVSKTTMRISCPVKHEVELNNISNETTS